jgi:acid phosphatase
MLRRSLIKSLPSVGLGFGSMVVGMGCAFGETPLLRFAAIADTGWGGQEQYAVANAMQLAYQENPFQFVILAGDNIYPNGEIDRVQQVFERPYRYFLERKVPFYGVLGNHDIRSDNGIPQIAYAQFNMPDRYYYFQRQGVDFWGIDTNHNANWRSQLNWLYKGLQMSKARWKIVFGHHPFYSSGQHGSNPDFIKYIAPLFKEFGVSLYLCGHDHDYERFSDINGTTYIVHGGGGAPLYPLKQRLAQSSFFASVHSFVLVTVYPQRITIEARDSSNRVIDHAKSA